ncbi:MAG: aspartate/glutamate racemase family protein [Candidatus Methanomethylicia archaeon]|nr:aspartate/glutamate racemase family protein [Candidatus Methanomethylicia archaeon]MDW7989034.1 aspartate/glutamate racemase family protein [Nitrososphaerota archaeon]
MEVLDLVKLGLIIPSSNTTMETEFRVMLPQGFTIHTARLRLKSVTLEGLIEMESRVEEEAIKLADADVDVIGYGCTSGSLFKGLGHDKMLEEMITRVTGKPAVATAGAVVNALRVLNIKNVAVATPYIDEINELEKKFLIENGFKVVDLKGLQLSDNLKIGRISSRTTYRLISKLKYEDADGIFISCTNYPTIKVIEKLENKLKKPIISSNTATLWAMIRKLNIKVKIKGYGKLLEEY